MAGTRIGHAKSFFEDTGLLLVVAWSHCIGVVGHDIMRWEAVFKYSLGSSSHSWLPPVLFFRTFIPFCQTKRTPRPLEGSYLMTECLFLPMT